MSKHPIFQIRKDKSIFFFIRTISSIPFQEYPERAEQRDLIHNIDRIETFNTNVLKNETELVSAPGIIQGSPVKDTAALLVTGAFQQSLSLTNMNE